MRGKLILFAALALGGLAVVPVACFSLKQPPCAFACEDPPHLCPENYTCGADFLCHRDGTTPEMCGLTPPGDGGAGTDTDDAP